jgi:integrase
MDFHEINFGIEIETVKRTWGQVPRVIQSMTGEKAGLPLSQVHMFRHTGAPPARQKGWLIYKGSKILGPCDINRTYNTYRHLLQEE